MSQIQEPALVLYSSATMAGGKNSFYEQACSYMLAHLNEKVYLDAICLAIGCNRNKLSALFQQRCGYSVMYWLREQRLKKAAELLRYSDMSVCFIALETGFSDSANFCHAFKRKYRLSPRKYRCAPLVIDDK